MNLMRNSQISTSFIIGAALTGLLAMTVFFFVSNSSKLAGIDIFNRTIFEGRRSGIDYVSIDPDSITYSNPANGRSMSVSFKTERTQFPMSSTRRGEAINNIGVDLVLILQWLDCGRTKGSCQNLSVPRGYTSVDNYAESKLEHNFETVYTNCSSLFTARVVAENVDIPESIVDNNEISFELPVCVFPPADIKLMNAWYNDSDETIRLNVSNRYYENRFEPVILIPGISSGDYYRVYPNNWVIMDDDNDYYNIRGKTEPHNTTSFVMEPGPLNYVNGEVVFKGRVDGRRCITSDDCNPGDVCRNNICYDIDCEDNSDCISDTICCDGDCVIPFCNNAGDCEIIGFDCFNPGTCDAYCSAASCSISQVDSSCGLGDGSICCEIDNEYTCTESICTGDDDCGGGVCVNPNTCSAYCSCTGDDDCWSNEICDGSTCVLNLSNNYYNVSIIPLKDEVFFSSLDEIHPAYLPRIREEYEEDEDEDEDEVFFADNNEFLFEVGRTTLSNTIDGGYESTISFRNEYTNPVVVAYIMTRGGGQPVEVRVRSVTSTGCVIFSEEPDNGGHNPEQVGYIVMESGSWRLPDGTRVEAGSIVTNQAHVDGEYCGGDSVSFTQTFSSPPAVLHSLNSYNNGRFMSSIACDITSSGFRLQQEASKSGNNPYSETIGWIAVESGRTGDVNGIKYETGYGIDSGGDGVTNTPHIISYSQSFTNTPIIVVKQSSIHGNDGSWARSSGIHSSSTHGTYAEESDLSHTSEYFSYWAFESNTFYTKSPVAYWNFDENTGSTAKDSAGNNDGTIYGASWTTGISGSALSFDGTNDYINFGDKKDFDLRGELTITAWVYLNNIPNYGNSRSSPFLVKGGVDQPYEFGTLPDGRLFHTQEEETGNDHELHGTTELSTGEWYFVAVTDDFNTMKFYVDGEKEPDETTSSGWNRASSYGESTGNLYIANSPTDAAYYWTDCYFNGIMDEVRIYNYALSDSEINELYFSYIAECYDDNDCSAPTPYCINEGTSEAACIECLNNNDCSAPTPVCESGGTVNAVCVECSTNTDCGGTQICESNECVGIACFDNADCIDEDACTYNEECINGGTVDSECISDKITACGPDDGCCPGTDCYLSEDPDCTNCPPELKYCDGECRKVRCGDDSDCGYNMVCENGGACNSYCTVELVACNKNSIFEAKIPENLVYREYEEEGNTVYEYDQYCNPVLTDGYNIFYNSSTQGIGINDYDNNIYACELDEYGNPQTDENSVVIKDELRLSVIVRSQEQTVTVNHESYDNNVRGFDIMPLFLFDSNNVLKNSEGLVCEPVQVMINGRMDTCWCPLNFDYFVCKRRDLRPKAVWSIAKDTKTFYDVNEDNNRITVDLGVCVNE